MKIFATKSKLDIPNPSLEILEDFYRSLQVIGFG